MSHLAELRALILRHTRPEQTDTPIPGLRTVVGMAPTLPIHHIYEPALAVVVQGKKQTVLGARTFAYGAGQYLVVPVDLPISGRVLEASVEEPFLALGLTLKPAGIATLLLEMPASDHIAAAPPGMLVSDATDDLLEPVARLLRLLDRPQDIAVLGPMIEREILWRLLCGEQGAMVRQIGLADSRLSRINHAIRWLREHYADILRIDDLARLAKMSPSSFHRHFRAITAMSPLQYQKQIRLQEARVRLVAEAQDVADIGHEVGYDSPSQFSREYSRLFGAPPARDAARLRKIAALNQGPP